MTLASLPSRYLAILFLVASLSAASQPEAPAPVEAPIRDLSWGQLNILHTTDTHGWHAGHLLEPSYSADWGDYISFTTHMRRHAEKHGQDLLVVDTGDRIEGNGLYDGSDPAGKYTFDILKEQDIDLLCTGNHELYKVSSADNEYEINVPNFKDSYLASNLDVVDHASGKQVPLAPRYKKFTTKNQGIRIMAFGFLFDFTGNANNTVVQPVEEAVKEDWFQDAIRVRDIDLFLVIGHVPVRSPEYDAIFTAIRNVRWDTAVIFLGGHTHIRDYKQYDAMAVGLESGRYMETIGFQSVEGLPTSGRGGVQPARAPTFFRRYIDNNLFSFHHHTGLNASSFPTEQGQNVSDMISAARRRLDLDHTYGCAETDLWMFRAKYPSDSSIFTWLKEHVLPEMVVNEQRASQSRLVMINTGSIRFDIRKGPFTRDSMYTVFPFTNIFRFVRDVPYKKAVQLLSILNSDSQIYGEMDSTLRSRMLAPPEQQGQSRLELLPLMAQKDETTAQAHLSRESGLVPGYTTTDDDGDDGDDTLHAPIALHRVPNVIQAQVNPKAPEDTPDVVDVVYLDFIEPWLLLAFNILDLPYSQNDTATYMPGEGMTDLLARWTRRHWRDQC